MHARDYQPGEPIPGTVYRVLRRIGAGGMGTVYDVEDTTIGKRYVLKTLHPQLGAREDLARRMKNEARTLARLDHPNIVEVFTAGVTVDDMRLPYYVMERLNGQSLRVVLEKKGQLERQHAYHIGIDLLDALDHAHDKGVIHRDVKPDNIFLHRTSAGVTLTKLLDFGIVSVLDHGTRETAGRFLGTLRYAAPEQLRGEKPTPKTDVYAAALVLYEILAGRGPFDDEGDPHRIGAAHLNKPPPPIAKFVAVPRELEALLMASLSKDPLLRPRDAFSFAASLRNLKRNRSEAPHTSESTQNRDTVRAALGFTSAPASQVDPGGVSPYAALRATSSVSAGPARSSARLPNTTVAATSVPTWAPSATASSVTATSAPASTVPDAVDRFAATNSLVFEASPAPPEGTAAMTETPAPASMGGLVPTPIAASLDWPPDRSAFMSEGPQVRSLNAPTASVRSRRTVLTSAFGAAALLSLGALALVLRSASQAHPGAGSLGGPSPIGTPAPPSAVPLVVLPAPTLDIAAFEAPASPRATPRDAGSSEVGASLASPRQGKPPAAAAEPKAVSASTAAAASGVVAAHPFAAPARAKTASPMPSRLLPDRPGPGF